jgi:phosphatidylethanolamine/phosphatidyl-N-methylethanolamine N-methyltransferase
MPLPALQLLEKKFEKQKRLLELKRGALGREIEKRINLLEQKRGALGRRIGRQIDLIEQKKGALERKIEQKLETQRKKLEQKLETQKKKIETHFRRFEQKLEQKNGIRFDDEVRFLRTWMEKPLAIGAVTPSGRALARTMAAFVDPARPGPIIELGPGTGPVTEALVAHGVDPSRLVLVEFDPNFCRMLRARFPTATVVQGDAYSLKRLLSGLLQQPAAAVVSGLPLFTKPLRVRLRLLFEAFALMSAGAPFVQFTYNAVPPIPRRLDRVAAEASERIWMNIPPARVWVYRRH